MNTITHDDTTVTLDTGVSQTRTVKTPKQVVARLQDLGIETMPALQARRLFQTVCRFYTTMRRLTLILFTDQPIRHDFVLHGETYTRTARYKGGLVLWNDKEYTSLSSFAMDHYKDIHPTRRTANGWAECKTLVENEWIKMTDMRESFLKK
jgi:hypothetical protein